MRGEVQVKGKSYNNVMPKLDMISDTDIASILTYIRQHFGNQESEVSPEEVAERRQAQ